MNRKDDISGTNGFFGEDMVFENHWRQLTIARIDEVIDSFPGKEYFTNFYLAHNGGVFAEGASFYASDLHKVADDYQEIEVGSFFHVPLADDGEESSYTYSIEKELERRAGHSAEFDNFVLNHIPFADNGGDNTFWLDKRTGEVKYMDYEDMGYNSDNAVVVACSFPDFCRQIRRWG